jgi:hypothetical protein
MLLRWLSVVFVVLTLVLSALPAPAQAAIITIRPTQTPKIIPSQADFDKITKLQALTGIQVLSGVSPDDQSMLMAYKLPSGKTAIKFLNVQDGSTQPVSSSILNYSPLTNIIWLDENTLGYYSMTYADTSDADGPSYKIIQVLVLVDRTTGQVFTHQVNLPGVPYSLSPNGSKALIVRTNLDSLIFNNNGTLEYRSPFNQVIHRGFSSAAQGETEISPELADWLKFMNPNERRKLGDFAIGNDLDVLLSSIVISLGVIDFDSGKVLSLGDLPANSDLADISWSGDSSHLAFSRITLAQDPRGGSLLSDVQVQVSVCILPAAKIRFLLG